MLLYREHDITINTMIIIRITTQKIQWHSNSTKQSKLAPFPSFPVDKRVLCPNKRNSYSIYVKDRVLQRHSNDKKSDCHHNPITSSAIVRWILSTLQFAGIDTSNFTGMPKSLQQLQLVWYQFNATSQCE